MTSFWVSPVEDGCGEDPRTVIERLQALRREIKGGKTV